MEKIRDLRDVMPRHWSSSGLPQVTDLRESFSLSGVFYLTLPFLLVLRSRQFNLKVSRTSCWSSKHSPGPTIHLNHNNPQNRYGGRFYLRFTAGRLMKNLPLMGFELSFNMWACQTPHALSVRPQNHTGCDKALVFVII